jgi:hypothetical protein
VFLVPGSWQVNYIVLAKPAYDPIPCPASEGHHVVHADQPLGLSVYGYFNVGSYAFVGGSEVKIINPIE